ncbi:MAG: ABC transporter substrate-binding protein [Thermodesulfobacteriota bacterium]|nr:ABC transporter substrate-binding protein [Thermodesulfobacteriota bacterium]
MKKIFTIMFNNSMAVYLFLIPCMILLGSADLHCKPVRGITDKTIEIGLIADLTGPSAGDIGLLLLNGLTTYTKHINDGGGLFGRKVKFITEDDRYSIPTAIAGFKKLLFKDQIFAFIGPGNAGAAKALCVQIEKQRVPTISYSPDEFMVKPLKRYIFLPLPLYDDQLAVIFDYIVNDLRPKRTEITLVYHDAESGKIALASAKKWAKYFNFQLSTEIIGLGALDATSQVMSIKRRKPTHIVMHHGSPGTAALLRDLKKFSLDIPVYGTLPTCTEDMVKMAGSASKNYFGVHSFGSWHDDTQSVKMMRKITLKYKPEIEKAPPSNIYTAAWTLATILYEGLMRTGKDPTIEGLITALESIREFDTKGLSGPVNFSATNHKGISYSKIHKADPEEGRLIPITDWRRPVSEE